MCCLFGLIDTQLRFTGKQKSKLLHVLASASEVRGTDATGVAYGSGEMLHIYKRPIPGHKLNFYIRDNSRFAMGHARMTTQGNASRNRNNHPFRGILQAGTFALAHNGVLYNDMTLRERLHLPKTRIETDSYIAVQLIEQKGVLSFDSLRYMAEQLRGSFTITVLDSAGITCNKNAIPNDPQTPFVTSGIRLGSPAMTTRGFREAESAMVGNLLADVIENPEDQATIERVRAEVKKLTTAFPVYQH